MSETVQHVEGAVAERIDRDFIGPMADFQNPTRSGGGCSRKDGTFMLVLVAAGGGMMGQAFPNTISRTAAVVAPGLMVMGIILFMGKVSGAHLNPAVSMAFAVRGDFPWRRVPGYIDHPADRRRAGRAVPPRGDPGVSEVRVELPRPAATRPQALLMEAVLTLGLVSVILGYRSGAQNIGMFGAHGCRRLHRAGRPMGQPDLGKSMNPARTFGPDLVGADFTVLLGLRRRSASRSRDRGRDRVRAARRGGGR